MSIVCPEAPDPPSYARQDNLNYTRSAKFADLDALLAVLEQVKAVNPKSPIRIMLLEELEELGELGSDFFRQHLIVIGGAAVERAAPTRAATRKLKLPINDKGLFDRDIPLPIARPIPDTETHSYYGRVGKDEEREFRSQHDPRGALTRDIGLIGRCPHPFASGKTVTVLSGITSRGVHGAALCLAHPGVRDENERYLMDTFGSTDRFCILMQVPVLNDVAMPPELQRDTTVLYEWSDKTGVRCQRLSVVPLARLVKHVAGQRVGIGVLRSVVSSIVAVRAAVRSAHRPFVTSPSTMIAKPQPASSSQPA